MRFGHALCLSAIAYTAVLAPALADGPASYVAVADAASPPPIDGTIDPAKWKGATVLHLSYDGKKHTAAAEPTTAYVLADSQNLYVAFDATQTNAPVETAQHTNNVGVDLDDEVKVALWPNGSEGFSYQFISTPIGTRYQVSSENLNYEPAWDAVGKVSGNHYTVTMRIPLSVMRNESKDHWFIQLTRWEPKTDSLYMANGGPNVQGTGDFNYAMPIKGIAASKHRAQPRFAAYVLGAVGAPSAGGATSRAGLDLSVPITSGTSFIGTFHPDFSNVEADQQTISPSAFQRYYAETRPFFAQGANFYNVMECDACPYESSLYTPAIPTPRNGYAVEGTEGQFKFGAFDAVGEDRNDAAQSVTYRTKPRTLFISTQRVSVNMPDVHDVTTQVTSKWDDLKHEFVYANYGSESGTFVTDPGKAKWYEVGGGYYTADSFTGGGIRKLGAQYAPYDGFVSYNDIAGYGLFSTKTWRPKGGELKSFSAFANIDKYHGEPGLNMLDQSMSIDMVTRSLWEVSAQTGSSYAIIDGIFQPLTQNAIGLTYRSGTSTPTTMSYAAGSYGPGRLVTWTRITNMAIGRRAILTLEADDTRQTLFAGPANIQWLERASVAFQASSDSSFAVGLRRFVGNPPTPNSGDCLGVCSNVSFAYHKRFGKRELYVAYGNPGTLYTTPQFLAKLIDYIGADKGT